MSFLYKPRFVSENQLCQLVDYYHLARTALAGTKYSNHDRMIWACKQFHKENPKTSETAAYKDLSSVVNS